MDDIVSTTRKKNNAGINIGVRIGTLYELLVYISSINYLNITI